jgi:NAD-dependent dihydropyrimidine dehydrogenase PreA subunit
MAPYDPWSVYAHITEGFTAIWEESPIGVILLLVTVIGSVLYDRFFCKYLCPMGALYGIIGKFSPFKVSRNENTCINCGMCSKVCPVNIDVAKSKDVTSAECLNCQICVLKCPKEGALENKFSKKSIEPLISIILILSLFFIPIWISKASGIFQVTQTAPKEGETIKPSEVRGYMTIKDASSYTGMSIDSFYKLFKIPENVPEGTKLKEISNIVPGYNFDKLKHEMEESGELSKINESSDKDIKINTSTNTENQSSTPANPYKGKIDPYKVKGSMTIREAAFTVNIDAKEFYTMFQIPDKIPDTTKMKEISTIETTYDFESIKASLE